jgi:DNA-binding transcriptional MerR regulator
LTFESGRGFTVGGVSTYRISQLAERSGVPATTLRFYETAGLLPAERTASGYRVYGEDAVHRLAFVASAKSLGLALEEIRDLLDIREEGVCASVRARMLPLVADRIKDAEDRIAELRAFSAHLAAVHDHLSDPAPAGACGPNCGCTTATAHHSIRPFSGSGEESRRNALAACTLTGAKLDERIEQWRTLAARAERREVIDDGLRLTFPPDSELAGKLAALAAAEQLCCAFLDIDLHLTPDSLRLSVRSPGYAAGMPIDLFGAPA